jgi:maleylpyruvate isomerase
LTAPAEHAHGGITATVTATDALINAVSRLDNVAVRAPSLLPDWTRAHVITHLARNADALLNLLIWARTGVEHPMYASKADRDADIEQGSARSFWLLVEDLTAACDRFLRAAEKLPEWCWSAALTTSRGSNIQASRVPWLRMREVWMHLVDLDAGVGFDAVGDDTVEHLLDDVVRDFDGRADVPPLTVEAALPGGRRRSWHVGADGGPTIGGRGIDLLAWLTGRSDGAELAAGALPALPPWA